MKNVKVAGAVIVTILTLTFLISYITNFNNPKSYKPSKVVQGYLAGLPYNKVKSLGTIGSEGHSSDDLKSDMKELNMVRDNYGDSVTGKFGNYVEDYTKYANDLFEVNHLTHYADYYSALWQSYQSDNFPLSFIVRNSEQGNGREKFTAVGVTKKGVICLRSFDFFIQKDIDEGEDFYTNDSIFDHVTYYPAKCNLPGKLENYLNVK
jgi:hypothetical protein